MATMTLYTQYNMTSPFELGKDIFVGDATSTEIALTDGIYNLLVQGSGLGYIEGSGFSGGTATSLFFAEAVWGTTIYSLTGANVLMNSNYYDTGYSAYGTAYKDLWGMQAVQANWLSGADIINGSGYNDVLNGYWGNDKLYGNNGDDLLTGGKGNDTLYGGAGHDTANYSDLPSYTGYDVGGNPIRFTGIYTFKATGSLASGTVAITGLTAAAQTDTFSEMELLRGSNSRDLIDFSSSTGNQDGFQGGLGNDTIIGGDVLSVTRNDGDYVDYRNFSAPTMRIIVDLTNTDSTTAYASAKVFYSTSTIPGETDSLRKIHGVIGTSGNDTVKGSAADDWFRGLGGNDTFNGAGGSDWIDYKWNVSALNITLNASTDITYQSIAAGSHGTDRILGVENIAGGSAADTLTGNDLSNVLRGRGGNDTLNGGSGTEVDYADYKDAPGSVTVTWSSATRATSGGADGIDALTNIEGVRGSIGYGDTLTGNAGTQYLDGRGGNDILNGGLGNDVLTGGTGADIFRFTTALPSNMDQITDFSVADDVIQLENSIFTAFGTSTTGAIAADTFAANVSGTAVDANDYIIYETDTGRLFYDADGSGAGASVQFALIGVNLALTTSDFVLV